MFKDLLFSVVASLGAAAVVWGLRLESLGEKEWYLDIEDFRSSKLKAHRGLKWVFWGVVAEMILGFAIAVWDGWEIRQANINAIKNDPLNQPVFDVSASVFIKLKGEKFEIPNSNAGYLIAIMTLGESYSSNGFFLMNHGGDFGNLQRDSLTRLRPLPDHGYMLPFHPNYMTTALMYNAISGHIQPPTVGEFIDNVSILQIDTSLGRNSEIVGGVVDMLVNGSIRKTFQILPQDGWNGSLGGVSLFATNLSAKMAAQVSR
jgi:hypothetical protein